MKIINHRINTISELKSVPNENGVEIDIRDYSEKLVLAHDPFCGGDLFEKYIENYNKNTLIINVKSDGVEIEALRLLEKFQIEDFFLLDCTFSMINKLISIGERRFAARLSEIESVHSVYMLSGKADWVWIDWPSESFLTPAIFCELRAHGFKICICSPDLLGQFNKLEFYIDFLKQNNMIPDAVCVKQCNQKLWEKYCKV